MVYRRISKKRSAVLFAVLTLAACRPNAATGSDTSKELVTATTKPTVNEPSHFAFGGVTLATPDGAVLGRWDGPLPAVKVVMDDESRDSDTDYVLSATGFAEIGHDALAPSYQEMMRSPIYVSDGKTCSASATFSDRATLVYRVKFSFDDAISTDAAVVDALQSTKPWIVVPLKSTCPGGIVSDQPIELWSSKPISAELRQQLGDGERESDVSADIHVDINVGGLLLSDDLALFGIDRYYSGCGTGEGSESVMGVAKRSNGEWTMKRVATVNGNDNWIAAMKVGGELVAYSNGGVYRDGEYVTIYPSLQTRFPCRSED